MGLVDPDPGRPKSSAVDLVRSETFNRIRIRKKLFWIWAALDPK